MTVGASVARRGGSAGAARPIQPPVRSINRPGAAGWTALKGWQGWLDYKRLELASHHGAGSDYSVPPAGGRIELADLKDRVRKLEAIAAGVDL